MIIARVLVTTGDSQLEDMAVVTHPDLTLCPTVDELNVEIDEIGIRSGQAQAHYSFLAVTAVASRVLGKGWLPTL